jgi:very-short-patch-repair endonuclease
MYPRGATNEQLLWRLSTSGIRVEASQFLQNLVSLSKTGLITHRDGRWKLVEHLKTPDTTFKPQEEPAEQGEILYAVSAALKPARESEALDDGKIAAETFEWSSLMEYYTATQRQDPRGKIEEFADRHQRNWQLITATGLWWQKSEMVIDVRHLAATFCESLSANKVSAAAIGWPICHFQTLKGSAQIPALIIPVSWLLEGDYLRIEVEELDPVLNSIWLKQVCAKSTWTEEALHDVLLPAGEPTDLISISERMRHALATLGGASLKPGDLLQEFTIQEPCVKNCAAFFLASEANFTRGSAKDLEKIARWDEKERSGTALQAVLAATSYAQVPTPVSVLPLSDLTDSQYEASTAALTGPLAVIQGPPGTGKSEVIVSLVLSIALAGKSVLIASKNHQAITEIEHRLRQRIPNTPLLVRASDPDGETRISFIDVLKEIAAGEDTPLVCSLDDLVESLLGRARELETMRTVLRQKRQLDIMLSELIERKDLISRNMNPHRDPFAPLSGFSYLLNAVVRLLEKIRRRGQPLPDVMPDNASLSLLSLKIDDLRSELAKLPIYSDEAISEQAQQLRQDIEGKIEEIATWRMTADATTRLKLTGRLKELEFQGAARLHGLDAEDAKIINQLRPVWAISTLSAASRLPLIPGLFDYVIFDEASQCDIASAIPLIARAKRAVVVGDPLQLRFIPMLGRMAEKALMDTANLPLKGRHAYAQSVNSLYDFCASRPAASQRFLSDQFRSAPEIVDYLNGGFYNGRLTSRRTEGLKAPGSYKAGLTWTDVKGHTQREDGGNINIQEAQEIAKLVQRLHAEGFDGSIGILSPFNSQINVIRTEVSRLLSDAQQASVSLRIATIDSFQGAEADVIIFSLVVTPTAARSAISFVANERRRLNVAISRSRAVCVVVGDLSFARSCKIRHIEYLASKATMPYAPPKADLFQSDWERRLDAAMKGRGIKAFPQYSVGTKYLDFAIDPQGKKLAVEVDGRRWHTDSTGNRKISDRLRDRELQVKGWTVMRFWVHELAQNMEGCLDSIESAYRH